MTTCCRLLLLPEDAELAARARALLPQVHTIGMQSIVCGHRAVCHMRQKQQDLGWDYYILPAAGPAICAGGAAGRAQAALPDRAAGGGGRTMRGRHPSPRGHPLQRRPRSRARPR